MTLTDIINDLTNIIQNQLSPSTPVLIYLGIGTFAGLVGDDGILAPKNYHQYPPFIQHLKSLIPALHVFIILIDPIQENPPYLVLDKGLQYMASPDIFHSPASQTSVYVWRECVKAGPHEYPMIAVDITPELVLLNNYAILNGITFVCHDFTGRRNRLLAEFFDPAADIVAHLDHIIYGMGARTDSGCYIDLEAIDTYMPFRLAVEINKRPLVKFFNIFQYLHSGTIEKINHDKLQYAPYMWPMIDNQKKQVVDTIVADLRNDILTILRQIYQLIYTAEATDEVNGGFFHHIPARFRAEFITLYNARQFGILYMRLKLYFGAQLDYAAKIREMDIDGYELLDFITTDADSYKWQSNIGNFF